MKKNILLTLFILILLGGCSGSGPLKDSRSIVNQYNRYLDGKPKAIDRLMATYIDKDQPQELRTEALRYMIRSRDPESLKLIQGQMRKLEEMEYWSILVIADESAQLNDPRWATIMLTAYSRLHELNKNVQEKILGSIYANMDTQSIPRFIDIYQLSYDHLLQLDDYFAKGLGKYDDETIVPLLIKIINDPKRNLRTREKALKILAQKNEPAFTEALVRLIGNPQTDQMLREFSFNVLDLTKDEEILLALLDFLNRSKDREQRMLSSALDALGSFSDPKIIPSLHYITTHDSFPYDMRKKALDALLEFKSPTVLTDLIHAFDNPVNLIFWPYVSEAVKKSGNAELYQLMEKKAFHLFHEFRGGAE
jgi:HEAT repeat protein